MFRVLYLLLILIVITAIADTNCSNNEFNEMCDFDHADNVTNHQLQVCMANGHKDLPAVNRKHLRILPSTIVGYRNVSVSRYSILNNSYWLVTLKWI